MINQGIIYYTCISVIFATITIIFPMYRQHLTTFAVFYHKLWFTGYVHVLLVEILLSAATLYCYIPPVLLQYTM